MTAGSYADAAGLVERSAAAYAAADRSTSPAASA